MASGSAAATWGGKFSPLSRGTKPDRVGDRLQESPVFTVGMGRSGTTLLARVLSRHPDLAIAPETHFLTRWRKRAAELNFSNRDDFAPFWEEFSQHPNFLRLGLDADRARKRILMEGSVDQRTVFGSLLRQFAEKEGKRRWGEKTPSHWRKIGLLIEWFPDARIVFLLRDPRGVIASREALDREWARGSIETVVARWIQSLARAEAWRNDPRVRIVRYEDLVTDASVEVEKLARFLALEYRSEMVEAPECSIGTSSSAHALNPEGPISSTAVFRWRSQLTKAQIALVESLARAEMLRCGYSVTTEKPDAVHGGG